MSQTEIFQTGSWPDSDLSSLFFFVSLFPVVENEYGLAISSVMRRK